MSEQWRSCSSCKKGINFKTKYYECSVSTCTGRRTGYVFCSVSCWETHLPGARHRDASAIEKISPSADEWRRELEKDTSNINQSSVQNVAGRNSGQGSSLSSASNPSSGANRTIIRPSSMTSSSKSGTSMDQEVLVVVSKMKTYVKEKADMNTAGEVSEILSHFIRRLCDDAIDRARADGRKTIMSRDFKL